MSVTVKLYAEVGVAAAAPPLTLEQFGGKGDMVLTLDDIEAAEAALETSGWRVNGLDEVHGVTARQAAESVLLAVGLQVPDRGADE